MLVLLICRVIPLRLVVPAILLLLAAPQGPTLRKGASLLLPGDQEGTPVLPEGTLLPLGVLREDTPHPQGGQGDTPLLLGVQQAIHLLLGVHLGGTPLLQGDTPLLVGRPLEPLEE